MSKYQHWDIFGGAEMELSDGPTWKITEPASQRQSLEHQLATAFVQLQREKNPTERTRLWEECQRLAVELEKLQ